MIMILGIDFLSEYEHQTNNWSDAHTHQLIINWWEDCKFYWNQCKKIQILRKMFLITKNNHGKLIRNLLYYSLTLCEW